MALTQKCQYALWALLELSSRPRDTPAKVCEIAKQRNIPSRFLEVILGELRQAGLVEAKRGKGGGYFLKPHPAKLTVGDVIRLMEGSLNPVSETGAAPRRDVFRSLWTDVERAVSGIYDNTSFQDLVDRESAHVPNFTI